MASAPALARAQTFTSISSPAVHWETCTCDTFGCTKFRDGWTARIDPAAPAGPKWLHWIRKVTKRAYVETVDPSGVVVFTFNPGVPCFADHRDSQAQRALGVRPHRRQVRPGLFLVTDGPNRIEAPRLVNKVLTQGRRPDDSGILRVHANGADWLEDLAANWNRDADLINGT